MPSDRRRVEPGGVNRPAISVRRLGLALGLGFLWAPILLLVGYRDFEACCRLAGVVV